MERAAMGCPRVTEPGEAWLDKKTRRGESCIAPGGVLLEMYNEAQKGRDAPRMNQMAFGNAMRGERPGLEVGQRTIDGKRGVRCYLGLGLAR